MGLRNSRRVRQSVASNLEANRLTAMVMVHSHQSASCERRSSPNTESLTVLTGGEAESQNIFLSAANMIRRVRLRPNFYYTMAGSLIPAGKHACNSFVSCSLPIIHFFESGPPVRLFQVKMLFNLPSRTVSDAQTLHSLRADCTRHPSSIASQMVRLHRRSTMWVKI